MRDVLPLDRRRALADVAAALTFGGRGGQQQLFVAQAAQQRSMPGAVAAVAQHARDLGLVHRIDHGGRGAGAAERVADIDHVGDASAFAAEIVRHHDAEQALGARRGDRFGREARVAIDRVSVLRGDRGDLFRAGGEARGAGCDASRGDLAAHHSARPGNTLQSSRSQMDRCVHNGLIDNRLRRYPLPQQVLQNFRFIATFSANYRASFA